MSKQKRILIISGELSGDQHAAKLVSTALQIDPTLYFFGMGGEHMRQAGVDILVENTSLAVVGVVEILSHALPIYRAFKTLRQAIRQQPPDLVVLIDYPGFNLRFAKIAKKAHIKVLYYISPQIWAWKKHRIHTIRKWVDKMLVIFPFEETLYQNAGISVEYVGHPLAGEVRPSMDYLTARAYFQIPQQARVIGLLPGSRKGEIKRLLAVILQSAEELKRKYPDLLFILPLASSLTSADIAPYLQDVNLPIQIVSHQFYNAMQLCDAAIVTSGTATLEMALLDIPMLIIYKTAAITYYLAKQVLKIPYIGLCNIVADQMIVQEFIQKDATPTKITAEISRILDDANYRKIMLENLLTVKEKLGGKGGSRQAAEALMALLKS